jgi:hypothetical protein
MTYISIAIIAAMVVIFLIGVINNLSLKIEYSKIIKELDYINNDGTKVTGNEHYSIAESCVVLPLRQHYKTVDIWTHSELIESVNNSWYMSYPELTTYDSLSIVQLGSTTESDKKYFDLKIDSKNIITCDAALVGFKKCEDDTKLDVNEYVGNINCFVQSTLGSTAGYRYSVGCLLTHPKTTKDNQTVINYDEGNFIFDKRIGVLTEYNSESDQYTLISMDENELNEQFPGFLYRFGPTVTSYLTVDGSNLICLDPSKDSLGLLDEYTSEEVKTTLQTQKSNLNTLYNTTISALESAITEEDKIKATSAYCGALIRYLKLLSYNISTCVKVIDITAAASILELGGWTDEKTVEGVIDFYQNGRFNELDSDILERVFDEYPDGSYAYLSSFEITPRFRHWVEYLNGND